MESSDHIHIIPPKKVEAGWSNGQREERIFRKEDEERCEETRFGRERSGRTCWQDLPIKLHQREASTNMWNAGCCQR